MMAEGVVWPSYCFLYVCYINMDSCNVVPNFFLNYYDERRALGLLENRSEGLH